PSETYREGLKTLGDFAGLSPADQDAKLRSIEKSYFFQLLRQHTIEGMFCDPMHGGNAGLIGWRLAGYPGPQMSYRNEADKPLGRITQVKPPPLPALLMQSAELHSHPLGVLDLEAGLGAPGVLQIAALELGLDPILLRVQVRNGVGDVIHFSLTALSATPRDK